jgi:hypothetical protein
LKDLEELEKDATVEGKVLIKVSKVLIKFLSTIRSNQLLCESDKKIISEERKKRQAQKQSK